MIVDGAGVILYQSSSLERVMGYRVADRAGKNLFELSTIHPDDLPEVRSAFARCVGEPGLTVPVQLRAMHADGSWRHIEGIGANLLHDPDVRGIILNYRDVTERTVYDEQLRHQAFHDALTDLPNRALFLDRLEHALTRLPRRAETVAVLFLDLDGFKVVNDSLGHDMGDRLLVAVAGRLLDCLRPVDTLARLGGDEFTVLLEDVTSASDAIAVAERIAEALQTPFDVAGREVFTSASIGIVVAAPTGDSPMDLLRNADVAMYRAKTKGKARHEVSDPRMGAHAIHRLELETELRRGLEREEFAVHYQPKVELETGRIVEVEALVRWQHPDRELVLPGEFIPIAEESGLIVPLGRFVLREACRQVHAWQREYPSDPPLKANVNLSAKEFNDPNLADVIGTILRQTDMDPRGLELEITESILMEDAHSTIDTLGKLKGLGVSMAIDDFGTGYSSLSYLKRFPVSTVKIDRSFVDGLARDPEDTVIVEAVVALGHALGLKVVAEGVERAEQLAHLRVFHCELAQGYHFAKPQPPEAVGAMLAACTLP